MSYFYINKNKKLIFVPDKENNNLDNNTIMNNNIRQKAKKKKRSKTKKKLTKKEYARLSHIINTYPNKFKIGRRNYQIIDNKIYYFKYNGYDDFTIIKVEKDKDD